MEKKYPPGGSEYKPHRQFNLISVNIERFLNKAFNNEGDGNQRFDHANMFESSRESMIPDHYPTPPRNILYGNLGPHNNFPPCPCSPLGPRNNSAPHPHPRPGPSNNFSPLPFPPQLLFDAAHGPHFDSYDEEHLDEDSSSSNSDAVARKYVDVYLQYLRSGNYYVTIVRGLKHGNGRYVRMLKRLRREDGCEGYIDKDEDFGWVMKFFGDRVKVVCNCLERTGMVERKYIYQDCVCNGLKPTVDNLA